MPAPAQEEPQGTSMTSRILQIVAMYVGMQMLMKNFGPQAPTSETVVNEDGKEVVVPIATGNIPPYQLRPSTLDDGATYNPVPQRLAAMWPEDSKLDIVIAVSPSVQAKPLGSHNADPVVLSETGFALGNYSDSRTIDTTIVVPREVQNNGTLWAHFFIGLEGAVLDPYSPGYDRAAAYCFAYPLTQYIVKKKEFKKHNLLAGSDEEVVEDVPEEVYSGPTIASYYHPNASLSFIPNSGIVDYANAAPAIRQFVIPEATGARDGSGQNSWYYPVLFVNTFWQLKTHMTLLNDTVTTLPLHIDLGNLADWKFKVMSTIETDRKSVV